MRVINFALYSIPAYVVHGNTLTYETWHVWRTNRPTRVLVDPETNGVVTELDPEDAPIITSLDTVDDTNDTPTDPGKRHTDDLEDGVTVDDPDTMETGTLDDFGR